MFLWFSLASSFVIDSNVISLTDKTFLTKVKHRASNEVWIVMFTSSAPACKQPESRFHAAAAVSYGMINFGVIDTDRFPNMIEQWNVSVPGFRIFHPKGDFVYTGPHKATNFLKKPMLFLPDVSETITNAWHDDMLAHPSALYFTDNTPVPALWVGISSFFAKKHIRCGFSNDTSIAKSFGIETFPTILFMNGTAKLTYSGEVNFKSVRLAMEEFFAKRLNNQEDSNDDFMMPDEFVEKCYGGRSVCVISVSSAPPESMRALQKRAAVRKLKLFVGKQGLPEKFMEIGGIWIYNPRKDGFILVENSDDLGDAMERVFDGTAKWQAKSRFAEEL